MSKTFKIVDVIDGVPAFNVPIEQVWEGCKKGGAYKRLDPLEYVTARQIAFWKGILLPALAKDTGDSEGYFETKLKLAVLPDDFQPYYVPIGRQVFPIIPSITILSKKKMGLLIEGSVEKCIEWGFDYVTLPGKELRKDKRENVSA